MRFGMVFGVDSSNWETWKMGWTNYMESGSQSVKECVPGRVIMSKGPRFLSESFTDGHFNLKYLAFT